MSAIPDSIETFIARWQGVTASELSTARSCVSELCRLQDVDPPRRQQDYMFERPFTFRLADDPGHRASPTSPSRSTPTASACWSSMKT